MDKSKVNRWWKNIQNWLAPPLCVLCGARDADDGLCPGCAAELPWQPRACRGCALPLATSEVCGACLLRPPRHDEAVAAFTYAPPVDALIRRVKFSGDLACARLLAMRMAGVLAGHVAAGRARPPDCLLPVPLHRRRLAARGYNQAVELARPLARILGVPLEVGACARVRETAEQAGLDAAARAANLRGAFAMRGGIGRDIAIIDDVMTTGHTVDALARVLRASGAEHIRVWVCARALPPPARGAGLAVARR